MLEKVINSYLALDPEVLDKLSAFKGKVIKLEITGLKITGMGITGLGVGDSEEVAYKELYLFPSDTGIEVRVSHDAPADTVLRGTPVSLFKMGLVSNVANLLLKGEVDIRGDTRLGHQFKNLFSQMDIDWSEPLAGLVGDGLAYQLHQSGKKFEQWSKDTVKSVSTSCAEYLQEESRDVVTETELNIFNDAVDRLRDDVDRLQARVDLLLKSLPKNNKPQ